MIRIAEDFGFTIGTFEHILEGYKVAPEIAKHGAGASAFADWWSYKLEAFDAIPYAAALMTEAGVLVSLNSDSDELARRLNTEAAKGVRYGGMTEEEALKLVTINAAKQLKVEKYVGSLEPGKDGDFAVWSGSPLSTTSRCEQTWIDGRKYFDREEDMILRGQQDGERAELIQKALKGAPGKDDDSESSEGKGGLQ
jgi:imidazolonepropionase-like amidohydrolase